MRVAGFGLDAFLLYGEKPPGREKKKIRANLDPGAVLLEKHWNPERCGAKRQNKRKPKRARPTTRRARYVRCNVLLEKQWTRSGVERSDKINGAKGGTRTPTVLPARS